MLTIKKIRPKITFRCTDESSYTPFQGISSPLVIGSLKGPEQAAIFINTTIRKPRWWQIWRWHLIPQYKQELVEAKQLLTVTFGLPESD